MTHTSLVLEREGSAVAAEPPRRSRVSVVPLVAMAAGLVLVAFAATVLVDRTGRTPAPVPRAPTPVAGLTAGDVSVVTQAYGVGEESGWHSHSGIHAVTVLSGVLTVYDGDCRAQTFEPGRPYVGGQEQHLVRNEGDVPVEMAVTYVSSPRGGEPTRRLPAPAGC
jgi:quercetin dioxygenase-like cupin family protein